MTQEKLNCWEYMKCGREPGGEKADNFGACPAATDVTFDGIHQGKNGGRICWAVAGTFCRGKIQGTFAGKRDSCVKCDFFKLVQEEDKAPHSEAGFLKYLSGETKSSFLNQLTCTYVKAGNRFITQGEKEDAAYIIHSGSCLALVEKNGVQFPVSHHKAGDIVGAESLLTGETRRTHVEAETDMKLWVLNKIQFDAVSKSEPELVTLLTEIVTSQFDSRRPVATRVIGNYVATDIIGRGGSSIVYKGVHKDFNLPVAIKMMRHNLAITPDFISNFLKEARIIARMNHENIVRVYDIEKLYRTVFIIAEHVDGISLKNLLNQKGTISPALAVSFLVQICSGLNYAHQQGIIHRDINPGNIFVLEGNRLKILDFGLACPPGTEDLDLYGTLFYMAPEQIKGKLLDQRIDIYALGVIAYEMLTGRRPFPENDLRVLLKMRCTEEIPDPADIVPDLPESLRKFIIKACRLDPDKRYHNVTQALEDIRSLTREFGLKLLNKLSLEKQNINTTIFINYNNRNRSDIRRIMKNFVENAQELGAVVRVVDSEESK
ncbi:MAG: protein kinase [Desulfobacterales bacterium]|nr:protein kinase [Desulfobacterales bacterium]